MKRPFPLSLAALLVVAAALGYVRFRDAPPAGLPPGTLAPSLRLSSLDGTEIDLSSLRGRVVIVNFWATWCPPCVAEMPSLEKLHRALGPEGLTVLGVSVDQDEAGLRRFVERVGITFPVLRDPGGRRAAPAFGVEGYPQTVVIDAAGRVKESWLGPAEWHTPEALAHFRGLLAGPAPGAS